MKVYYNDHDKDCCAWLNQLIKNGDITQGDVDDRPIHDVSPEDVKGYTRVHFFAGIGTWDYALNNSGWGDRPVWTASLPCQPFSSAGKRRGNTDERHLLPHYIELVKQCEPEIQFGEQVASSEVVGTEQETAFLVAVQNGDYAKANKLAKRLVSKNGFTYTRRWVDDLYAAMEAQGYAVGYCVLGAHSSGAAHIRQRLYWVADSESEGRRWREKMDENGYKKFRRSSHDNWMGNPKHSRLEGYSRHEDQFNEQRRNNQEQIRPVTEAGSGRWLRNTEGERRRETRASFDRPEERAAWSSVEWLYCRDNKYRPIKSGIKPLVDGFAEKLVRRGDTSAPIEADNTQEARNMRLKGYGNAIQAETAQEFISLYMNEQNKAA